MSDCVFCKIIEEQLPSERIYEDDQIIVIQDLNPMAPVHMLVIPKKHLASVARMQEADKALLGHMMYVAQNIAHEQGFAEDGFRLVVNTGKNGAQSVAHLHMHILAGRALKASMG